MELSKKVNDTPDLGTISVYVGSRDIRCLPPPYKLYMDTAGVDIAATTPGVMVVICRTCTLHARTLEPASVFRGP